MERYDKFTVPFCSVITLLIIVVLATGSIPSGVKLATVLFGVVALMVCLMVTSLWPTHKKV